MAQYRLSVSIASRGAGRSVVAMAAYRSGERLANERYGLTHDYTRRDGVEHSEIVLPANAPEWATDRAELWNRVEASEKRGNAQLAREVQLSLGVWGAMERKTGLSNFCGNFCGFFGSASFSNAILQRLDRVKGVTRL